MRQLLIILLLIAFPVSSHAVMWTYDLTVTTYNVDMSGNVDLGSSTDYNGKATFDFGTETSFNSEFDIPVYDLSYYVNFTDETMNGDSQFHCNIWGDMWLNNVLGVRWGSDQGSLWDYQGGGVWEMDIATEFALQGGHRASWPDVWPIIQVGNQKLSLAAIDFNNGIKVVPEPESLATLFLSMMTLFFCTRNIRSK